MPKSAFFCGRKRPYVQLLAVKSNFRQLGLGIYLTKKRNARTGISMMNEFLYVYYKAFIKGGIITLGLALMLHKTGLFIIHPTLVSTPVYILINVLCLAFCWLVLSLLIQKFPIYKILAVLGLLVAIVVIESYSNIPFNPLTISLLILFWLGVAYLLLPEFFKKYKVPIISVYALILSYFLINRISPNYSEDYHQNFLNLLFVPIPALAFLWIYEQWRWFRTLKTDKAKAELTLLRNQINPHFFFNTLNNLYGLTVEKSDQAPVMILKLSDIMRYTIYEGNADYVALKNEIVYLEEYIELQKIRYQKKVAITFHKDISHAQRIAPLLLVVPLENAFKHGIDSMALNAFVEVEISTTPTRIFFQVKNNFEPKTTEQNGIGLINLKKRLALIYPNKHQLEIIKMADTYTLRLEIRS